jgi:hypothetical protein
MIAHDGDGVVRAEASVKLALLLRADHPAVSSAFVQLHFGRSQLQRREALTCSISYAVTVWHSSEPRRFATIEVRTYSARRAEHLASESVPNCRAIAEPVYNVIERNLPTPYFRSTARAH